MIKPKIPTDGKAADYVPENRADARAYADFIVENFEPWDWPKMKRRRKRRRGVSLAHVIRTARRAGERGAVRVTLPDGTTITSEREGVDAVANPWDVVSKHAH